jgi:hypothetical protein
MGLICIMPLLTVVHRDETLCYVILLFCVELYNTYFDPEKKYN